MKIPTPASDRARQLGLDNHRSDVYASAAQSIRDMGPDAIPFLREVLEEQARVIKRRFRLHYLQRFTPLASSLVLGLVVALVSQSAGAGFWACLFSFAIQPAFRPSHEDVFTRLRDRAGALFTELAGKEHIGALIDLMAYPEEHSAGLACIALTRLFPQLQASDATLLTITHRQKLASRLYHLTGYITEREVAFDIALLKALQQIGDSFFVAPVANLVLCKKEFLSSRSRPVIQAASEECLPYLKAFAEQEAKSGSLVRSASAPEGEAQSTILVRPAANNIDPESTVLLRPISREEAP